MAEYFSLKEVRHHAAELRAALADLLARPRVAARPKSRQWTLLHQCLEHLLTGRRVACEFSRRQATQYKFEVEERFRQFYLSPGKAVPFVFRLVDRQQALRLMQIDESYPSLLDYVLLVSRARPELTPTPRPHELREYLTSVVDRAAHAEFEVYKRLPQIDLSPLEGYFLAGGPAYLRIKNLAEQHASKGRVISQPEHNPSTMRVIKVRVLELSRSKAVVRTQEYWYLRWWSVSDQDYVRIYQETNYQRYGLVLTDGRWLLETNVYPQPRSASPVRRSQKR
ncbi:MAG: hypothetical protein ACHQ9S_23505 [Candidatus Binatia bacterium]